MSGNKPHYLSSPVQFTIRCCPGRVLIDTDGLSRLLVSVQVPCCAAAYLTALFFLTAGVIICSTYMHVGAHLTKKQISKIWKKMLWFIPMTSRSRMLLDQSLPCSLSSPPFLSCRIVHCVASNDIRKLKPCLFLSERGSRGQAIARMCFKRTFTKFYPRPQIDL